MGYHSGANAPWLPWCFCYACGAQQEILTAMFEGGLLEVKVQETFELEEAGHAVAELEEGSAEGKIAIVVVE